MSGIQELLSEMLSGSSSKVVEDELVDAFAEKFAADEEDELENGKTIEQHDKEHHGGHFDPATMTCKFRDKMKKMTSTDLADIIYATSDLHGSGIEGITDKECGTIVIAGDFMEKAKHHADFPGAEKWWKEKFLPWCEDHKDQNIVIIGGNCDKWLYENRDKVEWPKNVNYLDDSYAEVNGMKVYGTSWCPHNMNGAWEVDDDVMEKEFSKIPEGLDILVTHVPPKGEGLNLDHDTEFDNHFGSEALTKAILEKKPKIVLCGHVHSGDHKPVKIGDSIVMNVSRIDDDRFEQSYHGRRIGVQQTDNGLGFLVDMDDTGRISLGKKGDIPESLVELRDALREAAKSIGGHISDRDFRPNGDKIARAKKAIKAAKEELAKFDHPKRKMLEESIKGFEESEQSGWKKPMRRIGKLFDGDENGKKKYGFTGWSIPKSSHHGSSSGSWQGSFGGFGHGLTSAWNNSGHGSSSGHYHEPWKGGMGIDDILKSFEEKKGKSESKPQVELEPDEVPDPRYDEYGMLKQEFKKNKKADSKHQSKVQKRDEEYERLVKSGDKKAALKMLRYAAYDPFYDTRVTNMRSEADVMYHAGTFGFKGETIAKKPIHFGTLQAAADRYTDVGQLEPIKREDGWHLIDHFEGSSESKEAFATKDEALMSRMNGAVNPFLLNIKNYKQVEDCGDGWDEVIDKAKDEGYDGIFYINKHEHKHSGSWIAFYPSQIKLFDITYDDNGNLIPLSKRFQMDNPDIRY